MQLLKQSSTAKPLVFFMADSSDHVTGKTGLSPAVVISKNGGSFAGPAGAVSEIGNGFYKVAGNASDTGTLGILALSATASGADQAAMAFCVVAFDPDVALLPTSTYIAPDNAGIAKIQAATYDTASLSGSVATLSNGHTHTYSTTGRVLA